MKFLRPKSIIKGAYNTFANVPRWLSWQQLHLSSSALLNLIKPIYRKREVARKETFEQASKRLQLVPEDLHRRARNLMLQSLLYVTLSLLAFAYMLYLLWHVHLVAGFLAALVAGLYLIKVFHCRFWLFQIKHRRLGCTWREWWSGALRGAKK